MGIDLVLKSLENRDKQQQMIIQDLKDKIQQLEAKIVLLEEDVEFYKERYMGGFKCITKKL